MLGEPVEPFGRRLGFLLENTGLSQASLAEKSGVDRSLISRIVRGDRKPSAETLRQLAPALALDIAELVHGTDAAERLDAAILSIEHDDYVAAVKQAIDYEACNRDLEAQLDALRAERERREDAERELRAVHHECERARQDLSAARDQIQRQEQELKRYRWRLSKAVARVDALQAKLRAIDEELASTKKSARLAAILSGVAALTGAATFAYFIGGNDSDDDSSTRSTNDAKETDSRR